MDHILLSTILALLLSLSQTHPFMNPGGEDGDSPLNSMEIEDSDADDVDVTTRILQSNNGSSEMLMEGDLVVPNTRNARKCWKNQCLWRKSPNGLVEVPYIVSSDFYDWQKKRIENSMQTFHRETCIRFVSRSNERDFISIENARGCYSFVGKTGGKQVIGLARHGCVYRSVIQHELNHALGFNHEQTRSDRDQYVRINWENIAPRTIHNFEKRNTNNLNTPYDYTSLMHYRRTLFSKNGRETITPIPDPNQPIGLSTSLSAGDILRIKKLYDCCNFSKDKCATPLELRFLRINVTHPWNEDSLRINVPHFRNGQ